MEQTKDKAKEENDKNGDEGKPKEETPKENGDLETDVVAADLTMYDSPMTQLDKQRHDLEKAEDRFVQEQHRQNTSIAHSEQKIKATINEATK